MITLTAEKRDIKTKLDVIRAEGKMPAVLYGRKQKSTPITISAVEFEKTWKQAGENGVVVLKTKEGDLESLIYDISRDPITSKFTHADFYVFEKGQKMQVKVPIEFIGVSPVVKDKGGMLVKVIRELEVEGAPKDIPRTVVVDVSALISFESQIFAKDITLPAGVVLMVDGGDVVASVYEPKEEVVELVAPTIDMASIEVEKKGKEKNGTAEGDAAATPAKEEKKK